MEQEVLRANKGLVERVNALQAQVGQMEQAIHLLVTVIDQFSQFSPNMVNKLKEELSKMELEIFASEEKLKNGTSKI